MSPEQKQQIEAQVFNALLRHLDSRKDVQNIELMNLAGFCRNCLARWYEEAAKEQGIEMSQAECRAITHKMPYEVWKRDFHK